MKITIKNQDGKGIVINFSTFALISTLKSEGVTMLQVADTADGGLKMTSFLFAYVATCLERAKVAKDEISDILDNLTIDEQADIFAAAMKSMGDLGAVFSKAAGDSQPQNVAK